MNPPPETLSLRALIRKIPTQDELNQAYDEIDRQKSDRAAAIIAAAYLEDSLRYLLTCKCVQLTKSEFNNLFDRGPLSSFDSMTKIGYAFGFYGSLFRDDLGIIREIRNGFAHAMVPLSFETPEVVIKVETLKVIKWNAEHGSPAFGERLGVNNVHRNAYANTCRYLTNELFMVSLRGNKTPTAMLGSSADSGNAP